MIVISLFGFEMPELPPIANIVIPFAAVLLITMSMMMGIRKKRRRSGTQSSARERVDELRHKQAVRGDLEQLMSEIEQLSKRFGAQLDAKTVQMERLIDEADRKIAELQRLEQAHREASCAQPPEASPVKPPSLSTPEPLSPDDELKRAVCELADRGHDPVAIAQKLNEHVGKVELILALRKA